MTRIQTLQFLLSISFLFQNIFIHGQSCGAITDTLTFKTQTEIDTFFINNYPGCIKFNGTIIIQDDWNNIDNITNLDGLIQLHKISGDLQILNNIHLISLLGLSNIDQINGTLRIYANKFMPNLNGLSKLDSVNQDLILEGNGQSELSNIDSLINLKYVGHDILIINFPALKNINGIKNIKKVYGDIIITFLQDLQHIHGLSSIDTIYGGLWIGLNHKLKTLTGLQNLKFVGDYLRIIDSNELQNLNSLSGVQYIGGLLGIVNNPKLTNCCGVYEILNDEINNGANSIGGGIFIWNNLSGCNSATEIINEGECDYICGTESDFIYFQRQTQVDSFPINYLDCNNYKGSLIIADDNDGINNITNTDSMYPLKKVKGTFGVASNFKLTNIDGLKNLKTVGVNFYLTDNPVLENINGLKNLDSIKANFYIHENDKLKKIDSLINLKYIHGFSYIYNNDSLSSVILPNLNYIGEDLQLQFNPQLSTFKLLGPNIRFIKNVNIIENVNLDTIYISDVDSIGNSIDIFKNHVLKYFSFGIKSKNINNFHLRNNFLLNKFKVSSNIEKVTGTLILDSNNFTEVDSFYKLKKVQGSMEIINNPSLISTQGFSNLDSIGGYLRILMNPKIKNIDGFINLRSAGTLVRVEANDSLENVNGFINFESTGSNFVIRYNNSLTDISGLASLNKVGNNLEIEQNSNLSNCCGIFHLINAEVNGGGQAIEGYTFINGNLSGCNSVQEILDSTNCTPPFQINNTNYYTLQEAITNANIGDTINLINNYLEWNHVILSPGLILKINTPYTITFKNSTLTNQGIVINGHKLLFKN